MWSRRKGRKSMKKKKTTKEKKKVEKRRDYLKQWPKNSAHFSKSISSCFESELIPVYCEAFRDHRLKTKKSQGSGQYRSNVEQHTLFRQKSNHALVARAAPNVHHYIDFTDLWSVLMSHESPLFRNHLAFLVKTKKKQYDLVVNQNKDYCTKLYYWHSSK